MTAAPLTDDRRLHLASLLEEYERRRAYRFRQFFRDDGETRRERYPKHIEFFAAGATYKERLFMAANRVGKSEAGAYELTCHATGLYPTWWTGRRFHTPIDAWACGTTSETTRDIVQQKLLGSASAPGTGMLPGHLLRRQTKRQGRADAIESIQVEHVSGGVSTIALKSYEQGRESFEGTAKHVVWCDEEPPLDCYVEMLYRTVTTSGIIFTTFTPLKGRSEVVGGFLDPESDTARAFKWYIQAGWDDVPHLPESERAALRATTPPYLLAARTQGEPLLGAGAIYPIAESELTVPTFDVPASWVRGYGMDVGWNRTAVVWGARDPGSSVLYLYSVHYQGQGEPASHAEAIRARGALPGVIDPACLGSSQFDGRNLMDMYVRLGLDLEPASNSVESGIAEVWQLLVSGRLKVMAHLHDWLREFRNYHRDDKGNGRIVKRDDHLMDATRYLVVSGRERLRLPRTPNREGAGRASMNWSWQ